MKSVRMLLLLGTGLLSACAGTPVPDWIYGKSERYPAQAYLLGVGSGADRGMAEDRARLEIAKIFKVEIRSREASAETSTLTGGKEEYRQEAASELTALSTRLLSGVTIAEVWRDRESKTWHALAVLDRMRTAAALREELAGLDSRFAEQLRQAEGAATPLRSLGAYLRLRQVAVERQEVAADLRVVESAGRVAEASLSLGEVEARIDRLAAANRIALELENDRGNVVSGAVVAVFAAAGMRLAPTAEADLLLRGTVTLAPYAGNGPAYWHVAVAQVDLVERGGGVLDTLRLTVREGSQDAARAEVLARELLGRRLGEGLLEKIRGLGVR